MKINSKNVFSNIFSKEERLNLLEKKLLNREKKILDKQSKDKKNLIPEKFFTLGYKQGYEQGIKEGIKRGVKQGVQSLGIEPKAEGGPVTKGKPYLVGEKGPEVFEPNVSGNIVPNENISIIPNDINPNSINQRVNKSRVKTVIQPVIQTQIQQVPTPVPMSSPSTQITQISKSKLPPSIAKMIN
tara:strand:- start:40 stop:594 length:555 start_codon:yes stop_codon:yes gene_type:complete